MQQYRVEARCLAFLAALFFSFPAVFASEQPPFPKDSKWRNPRIKLSISRSLESSGNIQADVVEVVRRSLLAWSSASTITFNVTDADLDSVSARGTKGDGMSLVTSAGTSENLKLFPHQAASPAAVTRVFRDALGYITEADIVLNPFARFSTDGSFGTFDLQETLTHEVGHLLGLEHSPVWSSVMFERASRSAGPALFKASRDELVKVDSSAIKGLYGPPLDDVRCCGAVIGRVSGGSDGMRILVWVEEADTGRVVAATVPDEDGAYRLDGVPGGDFVLLASAEGRSDEFASESFKLGVAVEEITKKNFRLQPVRSGVRVQLLGTSIQLAGLPIELRTLSQGLLLGVEGAPQMITRVGISGLEAQFEPNFVSTPSFSSFKLVGVAPAAPPDSPKGEYTLVITASTNAKQYLVGAIVSR